MGGDFISKLAACCGMRTFKFQKKMRSVLEGVEKSSFRQQVLTFCLIRQTPLIPFSVSNYSVGSMTRVNLFPFFLGTLIGCLPGNTLIVGAGAAARAGHTWSDPVHDPRTLLGLVGVLASMVLIYMGRRYAIMMDIETKESKAGRDEVLVVHADQDRSVARKEEGRRKGSEPVDGRRKDTFRKVSEPKSMVGGISAAS